MEKKKAGRPREYDLEVEAKALEDWMVKEDSIHLAQFAIERKVDSGKLYRWRDQSEIFRQVLKRAKDHLNIRTRMQLNDKERFCNERIAGRDISHYDTILKIEEREDKKFESELKQKEAKAEVEAFAKAAKENRELVKEALKKQKEEREEEREG